MILLGYLLGFGSIIYFVHFIVSNVRGKKTYNNEPVIFTAPKTGTYRVDLHFTPPMSGKYTVCKGNGISETWTYDTETREWTPPNDSTITKYFSSNPTGDSNE